MEQSRREPSAPAWSHWYWPLIAMCVAVLWVPFYNSVEPTILGFPFFYAYQMICVVVSAVLIAIAYLATR